ncbi:putative RING finger protein [Parathielavia hyrcaniae]|uniref:RING-type E3 ubiquitin transferase n=1 Tax=Parathielavia hyrcaniae TaxID=113614 RepID=A0AAN6PYQ9_9PEZI|nr:putative RING finger protein [Parathielavia hyrcaniae]
MSEALHNSNKHCHILQDTLQQISSTVAGPDTRCCVICLSDLDEPCETRPCQHSDFDFLCLVTWLETQATCPLCKSDVSEVRYSLGEDEDSGKVYKVPAQPNRRTVGVSTSDAASQTNHQPSGVPNRLARPQPYESEAIQRRRSVYRHNLYSLHVGSNSRQPAESRYRELTPKIFSTDPRVVSRARLWLRRELRVFRFLAYIEDRDEPPHEQDPVRRCRPCRADYLLEYIIAVLKSMDMQGSTGQAEELIREFLGRDYARLLLHELRAWLRSPCQTLTEWDRVVQYRDPNMLLRALPGLESIGNGQPQRDTPTFSRDESVGRPN